MPIWMNALGASGFGMFYGYVAIYILKRYLPPLAEQSPNVKELVSALVSLAAGGIMGGLVRSIDGINFIGAYGIGLIIGATLNVAITIWLGLRTNKN
jgi:hypothetical protein